MSRLIKESAVSYYRNLLQSKGREEASFIDWEGFPKLRDSENIRCPLVEIKKIVFDLNKDSMVGLDGFSVRFCQKCWDIVKKDVCEAITDFF